MIPFPTPFPHQVVIAAEEGALTRDQLHDVIDDVKLESIIGSHIGVRTDALYFLAEIAHELAQ
ncbi:MAG: hypothetical protein ACYDDZ_11025 [Acidimicrobiales bacterium]